MSTFAEIDKDGNVLRVIVIEQEMLDTGRWGDPKRWVQTSETGSMRGVYAGIGRKYDKAQDKFTALGAAAPIELPTSNVTAGGKI